MKGRLSSLQCLGKWHSFLLHCLNQCLSYARRQLHYLLYRVCLNQKTGKGWASSQINAFLQVLNLNRQKISCHAANAFAENSYEFNLGYYPRRCPGPGSHSVARGLVPQSVARVFIPRVKPRINLGATVMPLTMLGRSILGDLGSLEGCNCERFPLCHCQERSDEAICFVGRNLKCDCQVLPPFHCET